MSLKNLTKEQKVNLRKLIDNKSWDILLLILDDYIKDLNATASEGQNEFQILRSVFKKEGGIEQLKNFFEAIQTLNE